MITYNKNTLVDVSQNMPVNIKNLIMHSLLPENNEVVEVTRNGDAWIGMTDKLKHANNVFREEQLPYLFVIYIDNRHKKIIFCVKKNGGYSSLLGFPITTTNLMQKYKKPIEYSFGGSKFHRRQCQYQRKQSKKIHSRRRSSSKNCRAKKRKPARGRRRKSNSKKCL